jgi:hypothetical protein
MIRKLLIALIVVSGTALTMFFVYRLLFAGHEFLSGIVFAAGAAVVVGTAYAIGTHGDTND